MRKEKVDVILKVILDDENLYGLIKKVPNLETYFICNVVVKNIYFAM